MEVKKSMKKCEKCGINVENEVKFCPVCGTAFESDHESSDTSMDYDDIRNDKVMAVLAYLGFLVLIPMFTAKGSRFVRYHVKQGLRLLVTELIFYVGYCILSFTILSISWHLYSIVKVIGIVRYLFPALTIIGIINVASGREKELPVIGNIL